jgi:hypothetical protein
VGGTFERDDLTVLALYDDGATREVPIGEVTITGTEDFDVPGEKTITVSYGGKTASFTVTVGTEGIPGTGDNSGSGGNGTEIILIW